MQNRQRMLTSSFALAASGAFHAPGRRPEVADGPTSPGVAGRHACRRASPRPVAAPAGRRQATATAAQPQLSLMGDFCSRRNRADNTGVLRGHQRQRWAAASLWIIQPGGSASSLMPESRLFGDAPATPAPCPCRLIGWPAGRIPHGLQRRLRPDGAGRRQCRAPRPQRRPAGWTTWCANAPHANAAPAPVPASGTSAGAGAFVAATRLARVACRINLISDPARIRP